MANRYISIAYLATTAVFLVIYSAYAELFMDLVREDFVIEWTTCIAYFLAGGAFSVTFYRQFRSIRWRAWFCLFLAIGCIFVAGEEMSWGQRLFGIKTPEIFLEHNFQDEITLHNFGEWGKEWPKRIYIYGVFLYVVILPFLYTLSPIMRRLNQSLNVIIPPKLLALPFLCSISFPALTKLNYWLNMGLDLPTSYVMEITELFSGLLFLQFSILVLRSRTKLFLHPKELTE